jgi:hypothetical protein
MADDAIEQGATEDVSGVGEPGSQQAAPANECLLFHC